MRQWKPWQELGKMERVGSMKTIPNGTVTFLFTDIEGSTKLAREHPQAWEVLRARQHAILEAAMEANNGYVFQIIGDAFCVAFHNAGDALQAAIKSQTDLYQEVWGETPIKVRMGIHTGKAEIQAGGQYLGYTTMSRVQRLMAAGHGGQTLLSLATQELVRDELAEGITLRDMGEHRLKDLIHPEHIYQVHIPGLPYDFPALKTLSVQLNNLPAQMTPFIGREREITALVGLLRNPDVHLVTLTGAGGTGKTRLSLQVAAEILEDFEHGVWFVELASITDPGLVLPAIAVILKIKESPGMPIELALHENLSRRNLLLVIDNFEQVVESAPAIGKLMAAAPRIKVLISSREVLHLRGEHDYPVPPLGLPESRRKQSPAVLGQYEAIALFVQHANAANPDFELNEENASSVAEICMHLDGLPLAIELAAARSRLLKPEVMLEKLKSRLDVLVSKRRDLPERQQTIRGAIDWSYDLLEDAEKVLFARLAVFVGGWTFESAEAVCGDGLGMDVLSGMESLLDKSLLRQFDGTSGEMRFTMLETIREYALEKLAQGVELISIQQSHADYMAAFLDKVISVIHAPEELIWFTRLDDELDNLRSTVEWTLSHDQTAFVLKTGRLYEYLEQRRYFREPLGWLERALAMDHQQSPLERARAMNTTGNLFFEMAEYQSARGYYESALVLFRQVGDLDGIGRCLNNLGNIAIAHGKKDYEKARELYEQALSSQVTDSWVSCTPLNNLGGLARFRGEWQAAREYYQRSLEICERLGAEAGISYAQGYLCILALVQRDLIEAQTMLEKYLKAKWLRADPLGHGFYNGYLGYIHLLKGDWKKAGGILKQAFLSANEYLDQNPWATPPEIWFLFDGKARLELMDGQAERAAQLFGIAWSRREQEDYPLTQFERPDYEARIAEIRSELGTATCEEAFARGQGMTVRQGIEFALRNNND
jgi:predicted ATPase/class 3 adenylate cyclase